MATTEVKERPVVSFSDDMLQAVMDDKKTQLRRSVRPQPEEYRLGVFSTPRCVSIPGNRLSEYLTSGQDRDCSSPLGGPGDRLRVQETRTTLEITDVRVERLCDITEKDAKSEGVERFHLDDLGQSWMTYRRGFEAFWGFGLFGWQANPWVWVYEFKRLESKHEKIQG